MSKEQNLEDRDKALQGGIKQSYIKFHNVIAKLVKIENGYPIVITESMDSTLIKRQMIQCRIAIDDWRYATIEEYNDYESRNS